LTRSSSGRIKFGVPNFSILEATVSWPDMYTIRFERALEVLFRIAGKPHASGSHHAFGPAVAHGNRETMQEAVSQVVSLIPAEKDATQALIHLHECLRRFFAHWFAVDPMPADSKGGHEGAGTNPPRDCPKADRRALPSRNHRDLEFRHRSPGRGVCRNPNSR